MKVLWAPHDPWSLPQRARDFCEKFAIKHEVHFVSFEKFNRLFDYLSFKKIRGMFSYRVFEDNSVAVHNIPRLSPSLFSSRLRRFNREIAYKYIQRVIHEGDVDVVISTSSFKPPNAKKLIFDLYDDNPSYWREFRNRGDIAEERERIRDDYIKRADFIVASSHVLCDLIKDRGREAHYIPNGVDLRRFQKSDKKKYRRRYGDGILVGYIGNIDSFSGIMNVVEAARTLSARLDLTFLIAGTGPLLCKARQMAKRYGLKNLYFLGFVGDKYDFISSLDIGLLPSIKSRFRDAACPIKLLEYTAAGKKVVSTGLEEVKRMDFTNVYLTNDDARSLAEAINYTVDWKPNIPYQIKNYDIGSLAERYSELIEK